jgi:hypothetical protein
MGVMTLECWVCVSRGGHGGVDGGGSKGMEAGQRNRTPAPARGILTRLDLPSAPLYIDSKYMRTNSRHNAAVHVMMAVEAQ